MQHFLDTSVARAMLLGSAPYREYYQNEFADDPLHISNFVQMEFRRSYLRKVIDFYFTLDMPTIRTVDDAIQLWSNRYRGSDVKALLQLVAELIRTRGFDLSHPRDKAKAQQAIGQYLQRLEAKLKRKFRNNGVDSARCKRADVSIQTTPRDLPAQLSQFVRSFDDVDRCRGQCRIDRFILEKHRSHVEKYIQQAESIPRNDESKGFIRIAADLQRILESGSASCSCNTCERVGDAVIALDANRSMQLEHVDRSFNHLCPAIGQPHKLHPSETAVIMAANRDEGTTTSPSE